MLGFHQAWSWVVIVGNGMAGLWALGAAQYPRLRVKWLWRFTAFVQVTVLVQAGLGAWLMAVDDLEAPSFHVFYGFLAVFSVAIIYSYRQQLHHRLYLLYGLGGLFIMGLSIRAFLLD